MTLKNFTARLGPLLIIFTLELSCAHRVQTKDGGLGVVDFDQDGREENITISEKVSTDYGPAPKESNHNEADDGLLEATQTEVIALDLYPSLYNSLGYISLFSELEKENIKINIISSQGFSAVFAALYAKYESSNLVEWKAFALYQALGDSRPFSENWRDKLEEFLKEEFGDLKMGQLKKLFFVPRQSGKKLIYASKEKVVDALMAAVDLKASSNSLVSGKMNYLSGLKGFGADQVYRVSFLPKTISLKSPNGFVFGIYSKLAGKAKGPYIFSSSIEGDIDSFHNLSDSVYQARGKSEEFAKQVREDLENNSGKN